MFSNSQANQGSAFTNASQSTGLFSNNQKSIFDSQKNTHTSIFSGTHNTSVPNNNVQGQQAKTQQGGLFGSQNQSGGNIFNTSTSKGMFNSSQMAQSTNGIFGGSIQKQTNNPFGQGNSGNQQINSFGSNQSSTGIFGNSNTSKANLDGARSQNIFGNQQSSTFNANNQFNQNNQTQSVKGNTSLGFDWKENQNSLQSDQQKLPFRSNNTKLDPKCLVNCITGTDNSQRKQEMRANFLLTGLNAGVNNLTNPSTLGSYSLNNSSTGAFNSNQSNGNMFGNLKPSGGFANSSNSPFIDSNSNNGLTFNSNEKNAQTPIFGTNSQNTSFLGNSNTPSSGNTNLNSLFGANKNNHNQTNNICNNANNTFKNFNTNNNVISNAYTDNSTPINPNNNSFISNQQNHILSTGQSQYNSNSQFTHNNQKASLFGTNLSQAQNSLHGLTNNNSQINSGSLFGNVNQQSLLSNQTINYQQPILPNQTTIYQQQLPLPNTMPIQNGLSFPHQNFDGQQFHNTEKNHLQNQFQKQLQFLQNLSSLASLMQTNPQIMKLFNLQSNQTQKVLGQLLLPSKNLFNGQQDNSIYYGKDLHDRSTLSIEQSGLNNNHARYLQRKKLIQEMSSKMVPLFGQGAPQPQQIFKKMSFETPFDKLMQEVKDKNQSEKDIFKSQMSITNYEHSTTFQERDFYQFNQIEQIERMPNSKSKMSKKPEIRILKNCEEKSEISESIDMSKYKYTMNLKPVQFEHKFSKQQVQYDDLPISLGYQLSPSLIKLEQLTVKQMKKVHNVKISNNFGKIKFIGPINLYRKNINECVSISQDCIEIFDPEWENKSYYLTYYNFANYKNKDQENQSKIIKKMNKWIQKSHLKLIEFDQVSGKLVVKADSLNKL